MSDLAKRLRERAEFARAEMTATAKGDSRHFDEAADRIEALERERDEARATVRLQEGLLDALGAMARTEQAARREALEEAARVCEAIRTAIANGPMPEGARFDYEQAVRKLMEGGE